MGWGGPQCPLSWDGVQSFLSVHMWGFPRINGDPTGLQACAPGFKVQYVGEKLPGLGPFFGRLGLGTALGLIGLETESRAVPLGRVHPRRAAPRRGQ